MPIPNPIYIEKKNIRFGTRITNLLQSYQLRGKQGPYSPNILQNVLGLHIQIFLYLAALKCNTISDWLDPRVLPVRSCVAFQFANLGEKY